MRPGAPWQYHHYSLLGRSVPGAPHPHLDTRRPPRCFPLLLWRRGGSQGCSKVGPGHSKPEIRRPKAELIATPAEQQPIESGHPRNSGFGLRSSDFRAAEHDLPSTGRTLEQPWGTPALRPLPDPPLGAPYSAAVFSTLLIAAAKALLSKSATEQFCRAARAFNCSNCPMLTPCFPWTLTTFGMVIHTSRPLRI